MLRTVAITLLAACAATPAAADWRFTKWGMTQAEVVAAGEGQVVPSGFRNKYQPLVIKGPYEVGGIKFKQVRFVFENDKLTMVALDTHAFNQDELHKMLSASFGEATRKDAYRTGPITDTTLTFRDAAKGNAITLHCGLECNVQYAPLDQGF